MAGVVLAVCVGGLVLVAVWGIVASQIDHERRRQASVDAARMRRAVDRYTDRGPT